MARPRASQTVSRISRRRSLAVAAGGIVAAGSTTWPPRVAARTAAAGIGIGVVGLRYQGSVIAALARPHGRIVAVADVDHDVLSGDTIDANVTRQTGLRPAEIYADVTARHTDYRRLLDDERIGVILVGTPDHWHAKIVVDAVRAGKDVYCEKPLTLTIEEGKAIRRAVAETGRIVQVGSWQRSDSRFRLAAEMVRQGRIGRLERVEVVLGKNSVGGPFAARPQPANLDWDRWQGQTPAVDYVPERAHYTFRWWLAYSGGQLTDWGAHHLDIARWAIAAEPVAIEGRGVYPETPAGYDVPSEFSVHYRFADGVEMTVADTGRNGILFTGSEGRIFVNRETLSGSPVDALKATPLPRESYVLYGHDDPARPDRAGKVEAIVNHMANFFDCIASRRPPIADAESGHRSATLCHLGGIACRLGRSLTWDPVAERITGDDEADALRSRPQRAGFEVKS